MKRKEILIIRLLSFYKLQHEQDRKKTENVAEILRVEENGGSKMDPIKSREQKDDIRRIRI